MLLPNDESLSIVSNGCSYIVATVVVSLAVQRSFFEFTFFY